MNSSRPTILILTTSTGGGHLNLAQSLKDMLEPSYDVVIRNPQTSSSEHFYTTVSRHFVSYLRWQYILTNNTPASLWLHRLLTQLSRDHILSIIEQVQPQLVITTHAMLSYATARAIDRLHQRIPLVFQLTDLGELHMTWFSEKEAAAYLAPSHEIFLQAKQHGIPSNRLHITGRPIRRQFLDVSADIRKEVLPALSLDPDAFTVFLQGGARGSASADHTVETILHTNSSVQIILAVGNNTQMGARYAGRERVRTLSFTENIAPYMLAADVIAGKAGASSITEAFMLEKPFIATSYIPGQETRNLHFIRQHNLGWVCLKTKTRRELFSHIAADSALIAEKKPDILAYKAWNIGANQNICPIIDQLLT